MEHTEQIEETSKNIPSVRTFFPKEHPDSLQFSVIAARYGGKWLYVRHKERDTYELPGGHIEPGEESLAAAKRELYEESGAAEFSIYPVCVYGVERNGVRTYGELYYAEIDRFDDLPEYEIGERVFFEDTPEALTYPDIQPFLVERVREWLSASGRA